MENHGEGQERESEDKQGNGADATARGGMTVKEVKDEEAKQRRKKCDMAYAARMTEVVPGPFLRNVQSSHNREMLLRNHIHAIVSLTDARWGWWNSITRQAGIPESQHQWIQCSDSSTQDLLI
jgi:dual specificity phosphatase 12